MSYGKKTCSRLRLSASTFGVHVLVKFLFWQSKTIFCYKCMRLSLIQCGKALFGKYLLTLCLIVSSADTICKQFGPRSGPTDRVDGS